MELQWNILTLEQIRENGFVTEVRYIVNATDNNITVSKTGIVKFKQVEGNFIPFENLTQQEVVEWVKEKLGAGELQRLTEELQEEIQSKTNPQKETVVPPWLTDLE